MDQNDLRYYVVNTTVVISIHKVTLTVDHLDLDPVQKKKQTNLLAHEETGDRI